MQGVSREFLENLKKIGQYRWCFRSLILLMQQDGCKFVTLVRTLGASDGGMRQALDHLIILGWVMRNPGYGHPSRPEYILTTEGWARTKELDIFTRLIPNDYEPSKWSLQAIWLLRQGPMRHKDLLSGLETITPRALSETLKELEEAGILLRTVRDSRPPSVTYQLTSLIEAP